MTTGSKVKEGGVRTRGRAPSGKAEPPLVSIVTVVWNARATLERTIRSVLAQTYPNIEYVIVDGGSTDGTLDIIGRYDDRISYWRSEKDRGIYDAMNKGIALCTGDWVGMINADDWYEPDTVARVMEAIGTHADKNIVHGDMWIHYANGQMRVKHAKTAHWMLKYWDMVLNHPTYFVRRGYYDGRPFDPEFRVSGDHHWSVRACMEYPEQFLYMEGPPLTHHSAGGASFTVPFRTAVRETRRLNRSVGMGFWGRLFSLSLRIGLFLPQRAKLFINQHLAPDRRGGT